MRVQAFFPSVLLLRRVGPSCLTLERWSTHMSLTMPIALKALIPLQLLTSGLSPAAPGLCTVRDGPEPSTSERARTLLGASHAIVRARAVGYLPGQPLGKEIGYDWIRFEVLEVLRGPDALDQLIIPGALAEESDFNLGEVPYRMLRPAGQSGDCFAKLYQRGGEFVLLLRERDGLLTPYWSPLWPTNEQIRGADDPWLAWVRANLIGVPRANF